MESKNKDILWQEYAQGKQTYKHLAQKYNKSIKTIQCRFDKIKVKISYHKSDESVILMDTTYFGQDFGVMLFKDTQERKLYWNFVKYETIAGYLEGINL